ncbi:MAG: hypothetical protein ABSH08_14935 [Tepidisphaeraceae bacterium]
MHIRSGVAVDKTPVFDGVAGGFVYVYGGYMLENSLGVILSEREAAEKEAVGWLDRRQNDTLYTYSWEVKVLGVFLLGRRKKYNKILGKDR